MPHGPYIRRAIAPELKSTRDTLTDTANEVWAAIQAMTELHSTIEEAIDQIDEARYDVDRDDLRCNCSEAHDRLAEAQVKIDDRMEITEDILGWAETMKAASKDVYQAM